MKLDNRFALETAEGIDIFLSPAGLGVRSLAFFYDLLIRGAILIVASMLLSAAGKMGSGLLLLIVFLLEWFYPVIFEVYKGATPGKKALGLTVVYDNGLPVSLPGSLIRNLFRSIDILPFGYFAGAVCMMSSKRFKRIGDVLAGTMVVYKNTPHQAVHFEFDKGNPENIRLTVEQQSAIIAFAERSHSLSVQRQQELANIMAPVLGCDKEQAVTKLKTLAAQLVGKQ